MTMSRMWFPLLATACLMVSAGRVTADDGEDFWATYASWQKAAADINARVQGDAGSLDFAPQFHTATDVVLENPHGSWVLPASSAGSGYQFEILHVQECLSNGWTESPLWPLSRTLELTEILWRIQERMRA